MRNPLTYAALCVLIAVSACSIQPGEFADSPTVADDAADEDAQTKSDLQSTLIAIDAFVDQTKQGRNLSDMTLGLFISSLLGQLGGLDVPLSEHLHQDGRFIEGYLSEVFQYHPDQEIAFIKAMSMPGQPLARKTAAAALDSLRYIPDTKSSAEQQAKDRISLVAALMELKCRLNYLIAALP